MSFISVLFARLTIAINNNLNSNNNYLQKMSLYPQHKRHILFLMLFQVVTFLCRA